MTHRRLGPGAGRLERRGKPDELWRGEALGQRAASFGGEQQALAAIRAARLLDDITLVDQLFEHAAQALLGDGEDVEQIDHSQPRMPVDEMQHPVMRPAEAEILEDGVGIAGEIAIGEKQQLGEFEQLRLRKRPFTVRAGIAAPCGFGGLGTLRQGFI